MQRGLERFPAARSADRRETTGGRMPAQRHRGAEPIGSDRRLRRLESFAFALKVPSERWRECAVQEAIAISR